MRWKVVRVEEAVEVECALLEVRLFITSTGNTAMLDRRNPIPGASHIVQYYSIRIRIDNAPKPSLPLPSQPAITTPHGDIRAFRYVNLGCA
jgi:Ribonuclease G/E